MRYKRVKTYTRGLGNATIAPFIIYIDGPRFRWRSDNDTVDFIVRYIKVGDVYVKKDIEHILNDKFIMLPDTDPYFNLDLITYFHQPVDLQYHKETTRAKQAFNEHIKRLVAQSLL